MNILKLMKTATLNNTKKLRPMIFWTILEYAFRGAPYGILLMVVWELFKPLENPDVKLNIKIVLILSLVLLISIVLLYFISKIAYKKVYYGAFNICTEGRLSIGDHIRKLSMGFYNSQDPGAIGAYLINDYANVEFLLSHILPQLAGAIAMPMVLLIFMATQHWQMALISALVIPISVPMIFVTRGIINFFGKKHQAAKVEASSRMLEYLQGIKLIKAFNLVGRNFERLEKAFRKLKSYSIKVEAGSGPTVVFAGFILHGGLTIIILVGLTFLFSSTMPLPVYIMFLILGARVYEPLLQVFIFIAELNYHQISVSRLDNLLKTPVITGIDPGLKPDGNEIKFNDVTFRYHSTDVLKNISTTIPEHSLTALVGPSGSGKTTMTRLIARFWDVSGGVIELGKNDIKKYNPDNLLALISIVFQDVYLFNDSILNNILIAKKDADLDEVIEVAKKARCHDFINKLPGKYETIVGEGGSTLSGGEKQRISIARAMLKDSPIVLLDEATAALDPENELCIQEAINDLVKQKTVVIIAHRFNTLVHADKIIVLDKGRIVEEGNHDKLLENKKLYYNMWTEQQKIRKWKF